MSHYMHKDLRLTVFESLYMLPECVLRNSNQEIVNSPKTSSSLAVVAIGRSDQAEACQDDSVKDSVFNTNL